MTSSYQISTEAYEGPIDLFYDLVAADRIDLSVLHLSSLVEGFLSEISDGVPVDLEHLSQFVLVLALLCRMKARRMLGAPRVSSEEEPIGNLDGDLWYRLAHLTFQEAVQVLAELLEKRSGLRSREAGPDRSDMGSTPELAFRLDPGNLAELARDIMRRERATPDLDHLAMDIPTVEETTIRLWRLMGRIGESSFEKLSQRCADRVEEAVWFMGLMELARQGRVRIFQTEPQGNIRIQASVSSAPMTASAAGPA